MMQAARSDTVDAATRDVDLQAGHGWSNSHL